ncbi:MAG: LPS export ABC transporter periplasmic protein LptC [Muribaculum sp.]|nr:LPS export ABC transporter periplasmic protein LptC [Muribaculaceae bacterium]MCM1081216.1 LPS export ABC transporter periplasmic protein LptC [Muribaculum sp.]
MRILPIALAIAIATGMGACGDKKTATVHLDTNPDSMPTMLTRDVSTLISDSGITRYRITSSLWLVYDEAKVPVWKFPDGLLLEKFDSIYNTEATVVCDSATYFKMSQIWRLDGNVNILNTAGEKFLTQQLFWDQRANKIYSDSFIHIERADRTIEGMGFVSNDRMTRYSITNPTGIFPASDFQHRSQTDSAAITQTNDSAKETHDRALPPVPKRRPVQTSQVEEALLENVEKATESK